MQPYAMLNHLPHAPGTDSALDFATLDQLRRHVHTPTGSTQVQKQAQEQVARQFEALFIAQLLKQARQTSEESGGSFFDSPQTQMMQSLGDAQLAQRLSTPGMGLAQVLLSQIRGAVQHAMGADKSGGGAAEAAATPHPHAVAGASRLPTRAQDNGPRPHDAASISELIAKLGQKADAVVSAVREAPQHVHAFVQRLSKAAHLAARDSGVPAKLILSQAALESHWGHKEIRHADGSTTHNVFGIKAGANWKGKVAHVTTTEYQHGQPRRMVQAFRAYGSYEDAFADYARLIGNAPRYRTLRQAATPEDAAHRVQQAGYATDPAYADKLIRIMRDFQETHVDVGQVAAPSV